MIYMLAPIDNQVMLVLGFPLGCFANGLFAPMGPYLTELFPTKSRALPQGFSYNAGRAVGALFPGLIGYLSQSMGLGTVIGIFTIVAYLLLLTALSLLPETHGRDLAVMSEPVRA